MRLAQLSIESGTDEFTEAFESFSKSSSRLQKIQEKEHEPKQHSTSPPQTQSANINAPPLPNTPPEKLTKDSLDRSSLEEQSDSDDYQSQPPSKSGTGPVDLSSQLKELWNFED